MILEATAAENMPSVSHDVDHNDEIDVLDYEHIDNSLYDVENHRDVSTYFYLCLHFQISFGKTSEASVVIHDNLR